jgi:glycosyltransferase involved in cell wall biosynthesis
MNCAVVESEHYESGAGSEDRSLSAPGPRVHVLTFSSLYPNRVCPGHGIFVETRLRQVLRTKEIRSTVVAPVPWFPFSNKRFGHYAHYAEVPRTEDRHGIKVYHPRYPVLPKIGMSIAPVLMARAVEPRLRAWMRAGLRVDVIDAHYFYPDGVAAVRIGDALGVPVIITARGSDLNVIGQYRLPRRQMRWAASHAAAIVTVSEALRLRLVSMGVAARQVAVLRNGVDLELFRPKSKGAMRDELDIEGTTLLSVGNLVPIKGHDIAIRALALLPETRLIIVGAGPERGALGRLAEELRVSERVRFVGRQSQEQLVKWYSAADVLVLASSQEGWPNVLLEAMACGTPVVATEVGGVPEIMQAQCCGRLMKSRDPRACADAVAELLAAPPDALEVRKYAEGFSWDTTTRGQIELFADAVRWQTTQRASELMAR